MTFFVNGPDYGLVKQDMERWKHNAWIVAAIVLTLLIFASVTAVDWSPHRLRMVGDETAAIQAIKVIHAVEAQYHAQFSRYATSLAQLGPPSGGTAGAQAADLIAGDLAAGMRRGYKFTLTGTATGYVVTASPITFYQTGRRSFYSDQTMTIRNHWGPEPATAGSVEIQ